MTVEARLVGSAKVPAVRVYEMPLIKEARGSLSFGEYDKHLPFITRRYFIVFDVPAGQVRGGHAHREAHQFLLCVRGRISVAVDDGSNRDEILLDDPALGVYIPPYIWATEQKHSEDAVLLVLSSDVYDADEYIRDYDEFLKIIEKGER